MVRASARRMTKVMGLPSEVSEGNERPIAEWPREWVYPWKDGKGMGYLRRKVRGKAYPRRLTRNMG